ncbi:MAG: isoprenylcysteine carboxylmethyltransferase family protein [Deltaproteobacteria bacterium]|nr:isoprenylcysteine carboxylmethyltransferase family protein [Deltaproteobacteria bacterium]
MRINPPTLFWILIAGIFAVHRFYPVIRFEQPEIPWLGAAIFILGITISAAGKKKFLRVGTNVYTFEEPGELVTDGLYGKSRNPMYLGLVLAGFGAALVSGTLAAVTFSAIFGLMVRYWYVAYEERAMRRKFGDQYEDYCRRVRRWFGRRRVPPRVHASQAS